VVGDDEALQLEAVSNSRNQVLHAVAFGGIVVGDHSANGNSSKGIAAGQYGVENWAADIFKIDINAFGCRLCQSFCHLVGAMIDAGIKAQFFHDEVALFTSTGNADYAAALDLRNLAGNAAYGSTSGRDNHGLAGLGLANLQQAIPGGSSGHTDCAQISRRRDDFCIDHPQSSAILDGVFLPSCLRGPEVAFLD